MSAPLLDIAGLDLSISGAPILQGVSLSLAPGEILGLVGESGSGKSMTALAVMRLLPRGASLAGAIRLAGADLTLLPEAELCALRGDAIGMVFQEPMSALNPLMTIGNQVAESFTIHRGASWREARREAMAVLEKVGLPPSRVPATRYPHELSGGQRQRVVIAMAVALAPRLVIADEPTTALDVTTQAQILALLRDLVAAQGAGLLLITHDLAVVGAMADRIAVMRAGMIVEEGRAAGFTRRMTHPYSRALYAASAYRQVRESPGAPAGEVLLEVCDVVRDYRLARPHPFARARRLRALDGVSLTVRRGESVAVVGESGSGKSTLARAVLALEPVQGGTIRLDGESISALAGERLLALRRRVQMVFQDPFGSFDPRHRAARIVAEPLHVMRGTLSRADVAARVTGALAEVGLEASDGDKFPHEFSGGQRQRLAIARALITRPELIVLDEPVSALDVTIRAQILDLLVALQARLGLAMLFISHDLGVVRAVSDRVVVMREGRVVEQGPTLEVLDAPSHPYTRALVEAALHLDRVMRSRDRLAETGASMPGDA